MFEMTATSHNRVADAVHDKLKGDARNGRKRRTQKRELKVLRRPMLLPRGRHIRAKRLNARGYQSVVGGETMKKTFKLGAFVTREVRLLKCPHCGHEWPTKSKMAHVSCPNCARKVRVR